MSEADDILGLGRQKSTMSAKSDQGDMDQPATDSKYAVRLNENEMEIVTFVI